MKYVGAGVLVVGMLLAAPLIFLDIRDTKDKISNIESDFRAACDKVHGQTVWNGRQWDCIR